jgi:hypothetical protein
MRYLLMNLLPKSMIMREDNLAVLVLVCIGKQVPYR